MNTKHSIQIKKNSRKVFNSIAEDYDKGEIEEPFRCYKDIITECSKYQNKKILDVGCGTGIVLKELLKLNHNFELYGIDLSSKMISLAKKRLEEEVCLVRSDAEKIPYSENTFDLIICAHSFHHYPNPKKVLAEIRRVLKPKGILILVENNLPFMERIKFNFKQKRNGYAGGDVKIYSVRELARLIHNSGFSNMKLKYITDKSVMYIGKSKDR